MASHDYKALHDAASEFYNEIIGAPKDGFSDRASAVMSSAYLEHRLEAAIQTKLVEDKEQRRKLLKPGGPVGTLGAKANLTYLLGIIDKADLDDFEIIGSIRNAFAHWHDVTRFDHPEIRNWVRGLTQLRATA